MRSIDPYSYACGVMDSFNEMLAAGLKPMAMSHPTRNKAELDEWIPPAQTICQKYHTRFYVEDEAFLTDLFPLSLNENTFVLVFYRDSEILERYLALKEKKRELIRQKQYRGAARQDIALQFGILLGYPQGDILRMIQENPQKEPDL